MSPTQWAQLNFTWYGIALQKTDSGCGFNHLEKDENQWEGWNPIYCGKKKCLKPPTRICDDLCNIPRDGWCPALDSWPGGWGWARKDYWHLLTELVMFTHCSPNKRCCHLFGSTDIAEILALWLSNPALQQATFVDKLPLLTLWTIHKTWAKSVHSPFPGWATRESFPTWAGVDKVQCPREPGVRSSILGHSWILGFFDIHILQWYQWYLYYVTGISYIYNL